MAESVPAGPPPATLVGNLPQLTGGVHNGFPILVQTYNDPAFFSFEMPSNTVLGGIPLNKFGPTYILAEPELMKEMFNRPD